MQRWGLTSVAGAPSPTWGMIDNLTYNYGNASYNPKNQLQTVTDNSGNLTKGFKTAANSSTYTYDNNGNMITDPNKAITSITYNHLNLTAVRQVLPTTISFTNSRSITFMYDAGGNKLRKTVVQSGVTQYTQDYVGGIEYRTALGVTTLEAIYHAEGRIATINSALRYEYALKDHLGNTRIMFCDKNGDGIITQSSVQESNEVTQENHYYLFGLGMEGNWVNTPSVSDSKYTYNGKELNDDFGLGLSDYGARFYDAAIGQWTTFDPLAELYSSYSPYHYVLDNPIKFIDPNGMGHAPAADNGEPTRDIWGNTTFYGSFQTNLGVSNDGQNNQQQGGDNPLRVKVAEPVNNMATKAYRLLNDYEVETDEGTYTFGIDYEGYIDLTKGSMKPIENNVGLLRLLSRFRTAANMGRFVRTSSSIRNPQFKHLLGEYYRATATVGNGSSAAALLQEAKTGINLSTSGHLQKVATMRNSFMSLINSGSLSSFETKFAIRQVLEANRAIRTTLSSNSQYTGKITSEILNLINRFPIN